MIPVKKVDVLIWNRWSMLKDTVGFVLILSCTYLPTFKFCTWDCTIGVII